MRTRTTAANVLVVASLAAISVVQANPETGDQFVENVTATRTSQNVVLSWFGENAVQYQVEFSPSLTSWASSGGLRTGNGAVLTATFPTAGQNRGFFRIKQIVPIGTTTASYSQATAVLTITGDTLTNIVVVSRDAAGNIRINNGAVSIQGGVPTVANTTLIQILGREGNDQLCLDESNGALPRAQLFGEAGDDTLTGGSGADTLNGGPGFDILLGKGGADTLLGGDDNDTITGGDGDDVAQLGSGDDRFIWNPGDDTDLVEGGDGTDTTEVNGGNGAEVFTATANVTRVRFDRVSPAPFSLDIGTCENLVLNANGGDDSFAATGNLAALIRITVDGGAGVDTINGSNGIDVLLGGDGNDFVDGNQGNDVIFMGAGNDVFQWDPGDGLDTIEGQADSDTMVFNASAANENIDLSANGPRLRLFRNIANVTLDLAGIEAVQINALGGTDIITVGDLSATEVTAVNLQLAGVIGGSTGDSLIDSIILNGTGGTDNIAITQAGTNASIAGLKALVSVSSGDPTDTITINALGGNDNIDASGLTPVFALTVDGGPGNDTITGSSRADVLLGGDDRDTITGRQGDDTIFGGAGEDTFTWSPGEGNDVLEGQAGADKLFFNGANISETIDLSANGPRLRFFRDVANIILDCDDVERVQVNLLGGADTINIGELTATDVNDVIVDLTAAAGGGDGQADKITLNGTQLDDTITADGVPGKMTVTGLSADLTITDAEGANNTLTVNALGGIDTVDASALNTGIINLTINGGLGNDVLIGSRGGDTFSGGDGNDIAFGGSGDDTFIWNPGDDNDTLEGQAGTDTLLFNGANVAEIIDISPNGTRLRFTRNVASVVMDCAGVDLVHYNALGGADLITVNNMSGTGVTRVSLALGSTIGSNTGDAQPDSIVVNGSAANDTVLAIGSASGVSIAGLPATVSITGSEAANDCVTINTLAGDDTVDASGLSAGAIGLTVDGGIDDDTLIGSAGTDTLLGGDGDDFLRGGPGLDTLDGGTGNNVVIQD